MAGCCKVTQMHEFIERDQRYRGFSFLQIYFRKIHNLWKKVIASFCRMWYNVLILGVVCGRSLLLARLHPYHA